ncbi:MAG: hypothetical protein AB1758_34410, partial [Candidatus Eremiobacterota bacterium]
GVPHPKWGEVGRAYVVARSSVSEGELLEFCRGRLARYKTPKEVVFLSSLPKSPAGKVLKRMLSPGTGGLGPPPSHPRPVAEVACG